LLQTTIKLEVQREKTLSLCCPSMKFVKTTTIEASDPLKSFSLKNSYNVNEHMRQ
jgi:hypothetical protein